MGFLERRRLSLRWRLKHANPQQLPVEQYLAESVAAYLDARKAAPKQAQMPYRRQPWHEPPLSTRELLERQREELIRKANSR